MSIQREYGLLFNCGYINYAQTSELLGLSNTAVRALVVRGKLQVIHWLPYGKHKAWLLRSEVEEYGQRRGKLVARPFRRMDACPHCSGYMVFEDRDQNWHCVICGRNYYL